MRKLLDPEASFLKTVRFRMICISTNLVMTAAFGHECTVNDGLLLRWFILLICTFLSHNDPSFLFDFFAKQINLYLNLSYAKSNIGVDPDLKKCQTHLGKLPSIKTHLQHLPKTTSKLNHQSSTFTYHPHQHGASGKNTERNYWIYFKWERMALSAQSEHHHCAINRGLKWGQQTAAPFLSLPRIVILFGPSFVVFRTNRVEPSLIFMTRKRKRFFFFVAPLDSSTDGGANNSKNMTIPGSNQMKRC